MNVGQDTGQLFPERTDKDPPTRSEYGQDGAHRSEQYPYGIQLLLSRKYLDSER